MIRNSQTEPGAFEFPGVARRFLLKGIKQVWHKIFFDANPRILNADGNIILVRTIVGMKAYAHSAAFHTPLSSELNGVVNQVT